MCIHSGSWPFTFRCPFFPRWFGEHAQLKSHMMTFLFPPPGHYFQQFLFNEPDLAVDPKKRQCFHAKCVGKHLTNKACWSDTWELILDRSHIFVKSVVKDSLLAPVLKLTGSYYLKHLCSGYSEIRPKCCSFPSVPCFTFEEDITLELFHIPHSNAQFSKLPATKECSSSCHSQTVSTN